MTSFERVSAWQALKVLRSSRDLMIMELAAALQSGRPINGYSQLRALVSFMSSSLKIFRASGARERSMAHALPSWKT